jgi:hypothetical protein
MKYLMWNKDRLAETVALWNKNLGKQYPMREKLLSRTVLMIKMFFYLVLLLYWIKKIRLWDL